jgi:hypothetical protein
MKSTRTRATGGVGLLLLMLSTASLLTGCSESSSAGDSGSPPTVASVDTQPPPAAPDATQAESGPDARPVLRPDASNEDLDRMFGAWSDCLHKHGVPNRWQGGNVPASKILETSRSNKSKKFAAADKACASKEPEDYKDRLKRQDPTDYQERGLKFQKCLKDKNVKFTPDTGKNNPDNDPMAFSFSDGVSVASGMEASGQCEKEVFGSVK